MKFENIIKKFSAFVAAFVVFFLAGGMYLSLKGFALNDSGELVLVKTAQAQEVIPGFTPKIPANLIMPEGRSIGSAEAPITLYEYSSMGCYHCADFHLKTLPELKKEFIDKGVLRVVFVDFPIDKSSMMASMVAHCIPQDKYFDFVALLFKNQREWAMSRTPEKYLVQYASLNGITPSKATECMKDDEAAKSILENRQNAITQLGIQGTPSFIISYKSGRELLQGAPSMDTFRAAFAKKLENK